jgi:hypothetical protein
VGLYRRGSRKLLPFFSTPGRPFNIPPQTTTNSKNMEPKKIDWSKFDTRKQELTLIQDETGNIGLISPTGKPFMCIYSNPTALPHPTITGQVIIHHKPCNSYCPAFQAVQTMLDIPPFSEMGIFLSCCNSTIKVEEQVDSTLPI